MLRYAALIVTALLAGWGVNTGTTPPPPQAARQLASVSGADVFPATPSLTAARLYVANIRDCHASGRCSGVNQITIYDAGANGNVSPIARIEGSNTALNGPNAVGIDASRNIYVANFSEEGGSKGVGVTVYAAGANGNVAPIRTIAGSNTGLDSPWSLALDAGGKVYVTNLATFPMKHDSVTVYASGANGNVAPIQTIVGSNTGLQAPFGIALDASGNIYVTNLVSKIRKYDSVLVYAAGANGNVEPIRAIGGAHTGLDLPAGITVGASGKVYVANIGVGSSCSGSVTVYAAGANGDSPPVQKICGKLTRMGNLAGVALDAAAHIYVLNESGSVTVFPADANGDLVPMRTISGPRTAILAPRALTVR
jgi:hypothetical protein